MIVESIRYFEDEEANIYKIELFAEDRIQSLVTLLALIGELVELLNKKKIQFRITDLVIEI